MLKQLVLDGELTGRLIVGDAAFCQRDICRTIDDAGGYYLKDVKENQPTFLRECRLGFSPKRAFSPYRKKLWDADVRSAWTHDKLDGTVRRGRQELACGPFCGPVVMRV